MGKFIKSFKPIICLIICIAVCIAFACSAFKVGNVTPQSEKIVLNIWQIDSFEGGKGSRAEYLKSIGERFSTENNCYINISTVSADAARLNISQGNCPDLISYGAGMCGIEDIISGYSCWCNGGYCILTLDMNSDFSDVNAENTVINSGKDNFAAAAAMFCGIGGAKCLKPTSAYLKLINLEYKYLLGTQRDVFRLRTRNVNFAIKPVTEFNDLYQNISVTTSTKYADMAKAFVNSLLANCTEINKIGMLFNGIKLYSDEMSKMEGIDYQYKLSSPVSVQTRQQFENIISGGDINIFKNLLK